MRKRGEQQSDELNQGPGPHDRNKSTLQGRSASPGVTRQGKTKPITGSKKLKKKEDAIRRREKRGKGEVKKRRRGLSGRRAFH